MVLMLKKADSHQLTQPFAPKLPDLKAQIETRTEEPSGKELQAWQEALDAYANRYAHSQPLPTLDFKLKDLFTQNLIDKVRKLSWPQDLYIPTDADYKQYWFTPCPPDHLYSREWVNESANKASISDGHVFAFAAARPSDALLHSEAGVGFLFTPSSKLAVYKIQPTIAALGQYRWDTGIAENFGGTIRLRGFVYTAAWSVSIVDGSLSLVTPYGLSEVFDQIFVNQGAIPVTKVAPMWTPGPLATNIMLEGSHTYLISVIAAVQIDNGWTNYQGHPISSLLPDDIWKVWCSLDCVVSSVSVQASTIYIP